MIDRNDELIREEDKILDSWREDLKQLLGLNDINDR